jgi:hypothetical protein
MMNWCRSQIVDFTWKASFRLVKILKGEIWVYSEMPAAIANLHKVHHTLYGQGNLLMLWVLQAATTMVAGSLVRKVHINQKLPHAQTYMFHDELSCTVFHLVITCHLPIFAALLCLLIPHMLSFLFNFTSSHLYHTQ